MASEELDNEPHVKVTLDRIYERQLVQESILAPVPRALDQIMRRIDGFDEWRRSHELESVRTISRVGSVEDDVNDLKPRVTASEMARWKLTGYGVLGGIIVTTIAAVAQMMGTTP